MTMAASLAAGTARDRLRAARQGQRAALLSPVGRRRSLRVAALAVLVLALVGTILLSLMVGARPIEPGVALQALLHYDANDTAHLVVHDLRLPRTICGVLVGIALGVAGALMQAVTRNPLAEPGLLGVNAGASLAVVGSVWLLHVTSMSALVWVAFLGSGIVATMVYLLGSTGGGATPVRLALAGAAVNALLLALVAAVLLLSKSTFDVYRFWMVGSLTGSERIVLGELLPVLSLGMVLALAAAPSLNSVALGDDAARALGTRLWATRGSALLAITLLCGGAVAAAGPIGFVGLVVPHAARAWCGPDQRWLMIYSAFLGALLLVTSDVIGRVVLPPGEVQVGIMTALIGGPLFIAIVRKIRLAAL
jgi:iron complex transport system permease protein